MDIPASAMPDLWVVGACMQLVGGGDFSHRLATMRTQICHDFQALM